MGQMNMNKQTEFHGYLLGMRKMDAEFVKIDNGLICFDVLKGGKLDNEKYQSNAKRIFMNIYGLRLAIKYVDKLKETEWPTII